MPVCSATVFQVQAGPPLFRAALIRSSCPGADCWPGVPSLGPQSRIGTMLSRGMLITVAPLRPGEMCSSIRVSERPPGVVVELARLVADETGHVDALDAVPETAVLDVGGEHRQDKNGGHPDRRPRDDPLTEGLTRTAPGLLAAATAPRRARPRGTHIGTTAHLSSGQQSSSAVAGNLAAKLGPIVRGGTGRICV